MEPQVGKVAQIIDSLQVGGAQKLLVTMAEVWPRRGDRLAVITLDGRPSPVRDQLQALGVPVVSVGGRKSLLDPGRVWRLAHYLRRQGFKVAHTHLTHANIVGTVAGRLAGVPVVASLHNTQLDRQQHSALKEWLEITTLRHGARRVIAVGQVVEEAYRHHFEGKGIEVVANGVLPMPVLSPAARAAMRKQLVGDWERPLLVAVGRLTAQKGYPDLLAAVASLRRTYPALALVIAGEGNLERELRRQIAALELGEHVFLLGRRDDVAELLAAADIYVSASLWEGLPVATLEAMAAGLPVVATRVGEVGRLVAAGTGTVVPPGAPAVLAQALAPLLESPARRHSIGATARAHVLGHYDARKWVERLLALYDGVQAPAIRMWAEEGERA